MIRNPEELLIKRLRARIEALETALREIAHGKGPSSHDEEDTIGIALERARNTIEDMKKIARAARDKDAGK